jgi:hypothetical protein
VFQRLALSDQPWTKRIGSWASEEAGVRPAIPSRIAAVEANANKRFLMSLLSVEAGASLSALPDEGS